MTWISFRGKEDHPDKRVLVDARAISIQVGPENTVVAGMPGGSAPIEIDPGSLKEFEDLQSARAGQV